MRDPAFTGGGHLSELSLDRLHLDAPESDHDFFARANAHLAQCEPCRAALAARAEADAAFTLRPPGARVIDLSQRRRWFTPLTTLAAAATALLVARPWHDAPGANDGDRTRAKGGALSLRLQANDGDTSRVVVEGDRVHPGERVAFAVEVDRPGYLIVVGWDDSGVLYPAHPGAPGAAPAIGPAPQPVALETAIQLDDRLGHERFAAIFCERAFDFGALAASMSAEHGVERLREQLPECVVRATGLVKVQR